MPYFGTQLASVLCMPSRPRYAIIDDQSIFHLTWQCHNQNWLLQSDWAKKLYYELLLKYKNLYGVKIYSYCLMDNHPHLTGYCESKIEFSNMFRIVNSLFARKYNKQMRRRGQVVMDRFKSPKIETDADLEKVMFYVDLNPKRAGMVLHPRDYKWGSFHYYAYGKKDPLITPAPSYLEMGRDDKTRQATYQTMVEEILKDDWKEKKPYSSTPFIGNPEWVKQRYELLKQARLDKKIKWKKGQKERITHQRNNSS